MFDPAQPFVQTWADKEVSEEFAPTAEELHHAKRNIGHAYISSKADVSAIARDFGDLPMDAFVIKAAQKALAAVGVTQGAPLHATKVTSHGSVMTYVGVHEQRIGQLASGGAEGGVAPAGEQLLQVYEVADSTEALPLAKEGVLLSLHFTPAKAEVCFSGASMDDIACESFGDEEGAGEEQTVSA